MRNSLVECQVDCINHGSRTLVFDPILNLCGCCGYSGTLSDNIGTSVFQLQGN